MEFSLGTFPYIELNKLLKILDMANSGGEANRFITDGKVERNGQVESRKRCKLKVGDQITFEETKVTIIA